ncbi:MAG: response regulator transcription factor [Campylobacterota bacterium]|nr:response regulator transcription factor [Campylobacterota bacterium]
MKILLVEDDEQLNNFITDTFRKIGYSIDTCRGQSNKKILKGIENRYDLFIVDVNLPDINGLEIIKKIKTNHKKAKIFIISGEDNINTILKAYELGCDDYIKKPFDLRELIVKVNNLFKEKLQTQINITDKCHYCKKLNLLYHNDEIIIFTKKEAVLFEVLINNVGNMVNNTIIETEVWGVNTKGHLRQLVSKLKKTLPCKDIIHNHSNLGYGIIPTE